MKCIDIYTRNTDLIDELENEIKVYGFLQNKKLKFIPKLIFDVVYLTFLCVATEFIRGKIIEFHDLNQSQKQSCIQSRIYT